MTEIQGEPIELKGPLTDEQAARVAALRAARNILQTSSLFGGNALPEKKTAGDVVWLAEWILTGSEKDDEGGETLRESDLEWGRKQGRKEALTQAINVAVTAGATDVAAAIRTYWPNGDESPTDDSQLSFDDERLPE